MVKKELGGVPRRGENWRATETGGRLRSDMVQPATELAVAGTLLCANVANPAGIAFDFFHR
jgi:hypothetical protein